MSERRLWWASFGLALLGVAIAGYLTWVHYAGLEPICAGSGEGCERVQSSSYADVAGVPVALLGLLGYLSIAVLLLVPGEPGRFGAALLALIGAGFSVYLTYIEIFEIEAICQWCVASAIVMTALAACAAWRVAR